MALTWRDTYKQPQADVSGLIQSGSLAAKSIGGFGTALQGFDDSNRLAELTQFTDANALNEAIRRGQFNGASPEVLKQAMNRSSDLLANAASQQTFDFNTENNPLRLENSRGINATNQQIYDQNELMNPLRFDTAKIQNKSLNVSAPITDANLIRTDQEAEQARQGEAAFNQLAQSGGLTTPAQTNALLGSLANAPAAYRNAILTRAQGMHGANIGPAVLPSAGTGITGTTDAAGVIASAAGSSIDSAAIGNAIYGQESNSGKADTTKVNSQNVTGPMQVQKATFDGLKKNGVIPADWDWKNPQHNKDAGFAHIADLSKQYKTPEQVAAVYYSGPDAVNADGTINRNRKNPVRPNDPTVGEYVDQVMARAGKQTPTGTSRLTTADVGKTTDTVNSASDLVNARTRADFTKELTDLAKTPSPDRATTVDALLKGPLSRYGESAIIEGLDKVLRDSKIQHYGVAAKILQDSIGKDSSWNFSIGEPWRVRDFDEKRLNENIALLNAPKEEILTANRDQANRKTNEVALTTANAELTKLDEQIKAVRIMAKNGQKGAAEALPSLLIAQQDALATVDELNSATGIPLLNTIPVSPSTAKLQAAQAKVIEEDAATTLAKSVISSQKFNSAGYKDIQSTIEGAKRGDKKAMALLEVMIKRGETTPAQRQQITKIKAG